MNPTLWQTKNRGNLSSRARRGERLPIAGVQFPVFRLAYPSLQRVVLVAGDGVSAWRLYFAEPVNGIVPVLLVVADFASSRDDGGASSIYHFLFLLTF